jgi:uncharacterized membrane-anchored protein
MIRFSREVPMRVPVALLLPLLLLVPGATADAQEEPAAPAAANPLGSVDWLRGPATARVRDLAEILVPEGFVFAGAEDTARLMEMMENPSSGKEAGFLAPDALLAETGADPADAWFIVFEWNDIGYVENAEQEELDADAILESLKEGTKAANEERRKRGWGTVEVVGFEVAPRYDPATKNLEWAVRARSAQGDSVNHNVRLLGRKGVMEATLVLEPDLLAATLPKLAECLKGFSFVSGETYGEYRAGDKIWKYGLTGLIVGGGAAVAAKAGLFAKFFKVIGKVLIVIVAAVGAVFAKIFGRRKRRDTFPANPSDAPPRT